MCGNWRNTCHPRRFVNEVSVLTRNKVRTKCPALHPRDERELENVLPPSHYSTFVAVSSSRCGSTKPSFSYLLSLSLETWPFASRLNSSVHVAICMFAFSLVEKWLTVIHYLQFISKCTKRTTSKSHWSTAALSTKQMNERVCSAEKNVPCNISNIILGYSIVFYTATNNSVNNILYLVDVELKKLVTSN